MTPNTDSPTDDAHETSDDDYDDAPDTVDNDTAYHKWIHLYLHRRNCKHKIVLNIKKEEKNNMTPNTDAHNADASDWLMMETSAISNHPIDELIKVMHNNLSSFVNIYCQAVWIEQV